MRRFLLLVISILVVCLFSSVVTLHSQQQKLDVYNEVATPVIEDELTPQQREHSKLYERYKRNEKIRDEMIKRPGGVSAVLISCFAIMPERLPLVRELAEKADAVVSASFVSKSSQITADGTYVFTDYELRIEEVFKDGRTGTLKPESTITVTRPGGKVLLYGEIAHFTLTAYRPLQPGRRYLLFLSYIPSTGAYETVDANSSFDITDTRVGNLNEGITRWFHRDLAPFVTSVKEAVASDQKKGGVQ